MTSVHLSEGESKVLATLRKHPGSSVADLVEKANVSRPTVRNALVKLEARGELIANREWPRRYTIVLPQKVEEAPAEPTFLIEPDEVAPSQLGSTWDASRDRVVKAIESIDLARMDKAQAEKRFEASVKALTGMYVALRKIDDGPEWRREAGVK